MRDTADRVDRRQRQPEVGSRVNRLPDRVAAAAKVGRRRILARRTDAAIAAAVLRGLFFLGRLLVRILRIHDRAGRAEEGLFHFAVSGAEVGQDAVHIEADSQRRVHGRGLEAAPGRQIGSWSIRVRYCP